MRIDSYIDDMISDSHENSSGENNPDIKIDDIVDTVVLKVNNSLDKKLSEIENKIINEREVIKNEESNLKQQGIEQGGEVPIDIKSENDND